MKSLLTTREKEKLIEEFEISKKKLRYLFQRKRNKSPHFYNMGTQMEKGKRGKNRS